MNRQKSLLSIVVGCMILTLPVTTKTDTSFSSGYIAAGAALTTAVTGYILYSYFAKLSDENQIQHAYTLIAKANEMHHDAISSYSRAIDIVSTQDYSTWTEEQLKQEIMTYQGSYPFFNYVSNLKTTIRLLEELQQKLAQEKITLTERHYMLATQKTTRKSAALADTMQALIDNLQDSTNYGNDLITELHRVSNYITHFSEYVHECDKVRIAALERQLAAAHARPSTVIIEKHDYKPTVVQVHTTNHVTTTTCQNSTATAANKPVNPSAAPQQAQQSATPAAPAPSSYTYNTDNLREIFYDAGNNFC